MEYNFKMQRVLNRVYRAGISPVCEHSAAKLMKYLFVKDAYRKVKEKGAIIEVTG